MQGNHARFAPFILVRKLSAVVTAPVSSLPVITRTGLLRLSSWSTSILSKPKPVYTPEARNLHLEGEVSLDVIFSASGSVQILRVVQGLGHGLDQAAITAAKRWKFSPAMQCGKPVPAKFVLTIRFQLGD